MSHSPTATFLHGQSRLRSVKSLDLAFLVDRKNHRMIRRVQIQPHNIVKFVNEVDIATDLKSLRKMRFELMLLPDSTNSCFAYALSFGHRPRTPMRGVERFGIDGGLHDFANFPLRDSWNPTRPWRIFFKTLFAQCQESLPPQLNCRARNSQPAGDLFILNAFCSHQNHPRSLRNPNGHLARL